MDEWLSDRERGGFYASQDADISMDDDGDYFTWTLDEARAVLTEEEAQVAALHYDINEVGEMHHNPAKNVLYVRAPIDEIARRMNLAPERVQELLNVGQEENVRGAAAASDALRRQDGLRGMEQPVHFGLSGGREGAESCRGAAVCVAVAGSRAGASVAARQERGREQAPANRTAARVVVLRSEGGASGSAGNAR